MLIIKFKDGKFKFNEPISSDPYKFHGMGALKPMSFTGH
jgi:hypothetical protein